MPLVERRDELARLTGLLDDCLRGEGAVALATGAVACGKTELLSCFAGVAADSGALVLKAAGSAAERNLPLGVVGQLLHHPGLGTERTQEVARLLEAGCAAELACSAAISGQHARILQSLCSLVLRAAQETPVVVLVDDVHHSDELSLQWLLFLVRRLRTAAVLVVLTEWAGPDLTLPSFKAELLGQPHCHRLRLGPLSQDGVTELLTSRLGSPVPAPIAAAYYAASGGNPSVVLALAEDHRAAGRGPAVHLTGSVFGDAFREAVLGCVHRCGPAVLRGAAGLAVLDGAGGESSLSALTGLDATVARKIVDVLEAGGLLDGTRFRRPEVRTAVLDTLSGEERAALHRTAARLLLDEGAPSTAVAGHLLAVGESCQPWGVALLQEAADQAIADDRPELAVDYLRLAQRSPSDEQTSAAIVTKLAHVEWRRNPAAVIRQLPQLVAAVRGGHLPDQDVIAPLSYLLWHGHLDQAADALRQIGETAPDQAMQAFGLWVAASYPPLLSALPIPPCGPVEHAGDPATIDPRLRATATMIGVLREGGSPAAVTDAEHVLQSCRLGHSTLEAVRTALQSLVYADRPDKALPWCEALLAEAELRRAPTWQAMLAAIRADIALRQGNLPDARSYARSALALMTEHSWGVAIGMPLAVLLQATTAMGDYAEAERVLAIPVPEQLFRTRWGLSYRHARGLYYLETDRLQAALTDLLRCGELMVEWDMDLPALVPWRSDAARVHLRLGRDQQARKLTEEQLERPGARRGRTHGITLRVLAAAGELRHRPQLLRRSMEQLLDCGDQLELAHTLADLGEALHAIGDSDRARMTVRRAWYVAKECHADSLRARLALTWSDSDIDETVADVAEGDEDLTALSDAERRVAGLAAMGHTNREIARKLYITVSTVEQHLTRAYRKLDVRRRTDLPVRLHPTAS
ncbi:AAA family ATPase [Allokutzneria sp. A3M-2-11 16]|uniref:AAA family ATPase n=1 Tax=Allokutzneria sp. A3M-2-11 16 TaxID=2962043 RepID=UPI0020B6AE3D|nr:LuxR family transcriptional regulator [Allokutzneria sp. A3M-2-11 16]MCP3803245.1 AAA family ATPase [Allokutzneria sp. A3M-2-11 16]